MTTASIQLVLPGLFDLPLQDCDAGFIKSGLPNLNRLLSCSDSIPNNLHTIDSMIASAHHWKDVQALPLAQAFLEGKQHKTEQILLFQAVYLRADLQDALIFPIDNGSKNESDLSLIINDLQDIFKVDFDIKVVAENLFLLQLKEIMAPSHYPHVLSVLGKAANPYFDQTRENLPWYRLVNEMQMFLHQHEVNQRRIHDGHLAINSFWFWGSGAVPEMSTSRPQWYCDDAILSHFAKSCGLQVLPVEVLKDQPPAVDSIIVDLSLISALKSSAAVDLEEILTHIDKDILVPMLNSGLPLRLRAGFDQDFMWKSHSRFKFWRQGRNLQDYVSLSIQP